MFPALSAPIVFAHRGASLYAPENTLSAFQLAVEQGAPAIELDVQLTADQEVIVFHDSHLDRTTNGTGPVADHYLGDLKKLNASAGFPAGFQDEKIPTLNEVFERLPKDLLINIELKNISSPFDHLPRQTARVIRTHHAEDRVLISSFNPHSLARFHDLCPDLPQGRLLYNPLLIQLFRISPWLAKRFQSLHLPFRSLSTTLVRRFRSSGYRVFSYTLNTAEDILTGLKLGLDGFFTDDPPLALDLLAQFQSISTSDESNPASSWERR